MEKVYFHMFTQNVEVIRLDKLNIQILAERKLVNFLHFVFIHMICSQNRENLNIIPKMSVYLNNLLKHCSHVL